MKLSENVRGMAETPKNVDRCYLNNIADSIEVLEFNDLDFLTLRDSFAMAALQGIISRIGSDPQYAAKYAYAYADEMMEVR